MLFNLNYRAESVYGNSKQFRHPSEMTDASIHNPRSPREPIYGSSAGAGAVAASASASGPPSDFSNRSTKIESFQLEPVYGTRRDVEQQNRNEMLYGGRKVTPSYSARQVESSYTITSAASSVPTGRQDLETSNNSGAPISPSDTSKDSAYGSVHGAALPATVEWQTANQDTALQNQNNYNSHFNASKQCQAGAFQQQHYGQKFRADLLSPASQHSPTHTTGSFHSPVQY